MKSRLLAVLIVVSGCVAAWAGADADTAISLAIQLRDLGDFTAADTVIDKALASKRLSAGDRQKLSFQRDQSRRIRADFPYSKEDLFTDLTGAVGNLTREEFEKWIGDHWFDSHAIDGKIRYVANSVNNLWYQHPELQPRRTHWHDIISEQKGRLGEAREIKRTARKLGKPYVLPHRFKCVMTVSADRDSAPAGEVVRAWLPIPRAYPFQSDFKLLASSTSIKETEPENSPIRSVYMEQTAEAGKPTRFEISYSYTAEGVFFDLDPKRVVPPDLGDPELKKFVSEAPHVVFTSKIKSLASQLAGRETNSLVVAKAIYDWIGANVKYSYAREYSTLTNISDYCLCNRYGDCGQLSLLFITLCRACDIPARWQTGWNLFPGTVCNHDWAEIYLAPYGWVPVDPWGGLYATQQCPNLTEAERRELHDFYFGGLDAYRMISNGDHSQQLHPGKNSPRSDDVDFQRGELEYGDHNIYFTQFNYDLTVTNLP